MSTREIQLPRKLTNQLLHLAQMSPETEICGLIGADAQGLPVTCYPINNTASTPHNRFQLDSRQQISAMKTMRDQHQTLFAIYHSHPSAPALPSVTDIEHAAYPEAIHLIISLNTQGVLELRAFSITDQQVKALDLSLIES